MENSCKFLALSALCCMILFGTLVTPRYLLLKLLCCMSVALLDFFFSSFSSVYVIQRAEIGYSCSMILFEFCHWAFYPGWILWSMSPVCSLLLLQLYHLCAIAFNCCHHPENVCYANTCFVSEPFESKIRDGGWGVEAVQVEKAPRIQ